MIDIGFDEPIRAEFIDPFWQEHSEKILSIRKAIDYPKTRIGEQIVVNQQNAPVFLVYNRLPEIFSSIVSMIEYDEIFKKQGDDFFKDPINQRAVVKAFALVVEDAVKSSQKPEQLKNYEDHLPFFNALINKLKAFDSLVEKETTYPNIVNSLITVFSQSVNETPGVENFNVKTDKIRKIVKDYLPDYETIDAGRLLRTQVEMIKQSPKT